LDIKECSSKWDAVIAECKMLDVPEKCATKEDLADLLDRIHAILGAED